MTKSELEYGRRMLAVIRWNERKQQEALLVPDPEAARRYKRNQKAIFIKVVRALQLFPERIGGG